VTARLGSCAAPGETSTEMERTRFAGYLPTAKSASTNRENRVLRVPATLRSHGLPFRQSLHQRTCETCRHLAKTFNWQEYNPYQYLRALHHAAENRSADGSSPPLGTTKPITIAPWSGLRGTSMPGIPDGSRLTLRCPRRTACRWPLARREGCVEGSPHGASRVTRPSVADNSRPFLRKALR
jgi:hypothetical protein